MYFLIFRLHFMVDYRKTLYSITKCSNVFFFPVRLYYLQFIHDNNNNNQPSPFFLLKNFMEQQQHTARSRVIKSHLITTYNFRPILDNKDIKNSNKQKLTPNFDDGYETSSRKKGKKLTSSFRHYSKFQNISWWELIVERHVYDNRIFLQNWSWQILYLYNT